MDFDAHDSLIGPN